MLLKYCKITYFEIIYVYYFHKYNNNVACSVTEWLDNSPSIAEVPSSPLGPSIARVRKSRY